MLYSHCTTRTPAPWLLRLPLRARSLHDESVRHWDHVWNQRYEFLTRERELRALDDATLDATLAWFRKYVAVGAPER